MGRALKAQGQGKVPAGEESSPKQDPVPGERASWNLLRREQQVDRTEGTGGAVLGEQETSLPQQQQEREVNVETHLEAKGKAGGVWALSLQ